MIVEYASVRISIILMNIYIKNHKYHSLLLSLWYHITMAVNFSITKDAHHVVLLIIRFYIQVPFVLVLNTTFLSYQHGSNALQV